MAQMATISAQIDNNDKIRFDEFCNAVGINASSAINMFVKAVLRLHEIPFAIACDEDPFYSETNMAELRLRAQDLRVERKTESESLND